MDTNQIDDRTRFNNAMKERTLSAFPTEYEQATITRLVLVGYNELFVTPAGRAGRWTASLGTFGAFEIQFVRITSLETDELNMWAVLCAPHTKTSLATCRFNRAEDAMFAVQNLILVGEEFIRQSALRRDES